MKFREKIFKRSKQPSCDDIQAAVRKKYAEVSQSAEGKFKYPTGEAGASALDYDLSILGEMPDEVVEAFCGVGNPFTLGPIRSGETVLDIGCGAGFDLIVASNFVGPEGKVCGIDLTREMIENAEKNFTKADVNNGTVVQAGAEEIPYEDNTFNVVISNGVLNLSPLKEKSFTEIYRVLKPEGRLQFADIVLKGDLPPKVSGSLEAWSD